MTPVSVVDLFCGIGGMTHGFRLEGYHIAAGIDVDPTCRYAFETNNDATFLLRDVSEMRGKEISDLYPKDSLRVLVGCAPCQPFSSYTNRKTPDQKWRLLASFARLAREVKPDVVSMENVPGLERHGIFSEFTAELEAAGYTVSYFVVRTTDYGVPQRRNRLVLFGSKFGPVALIDPTHARPVTLRETIGHLPPICAGEVCKDDRLHRARGLTPQNLSRLRATRPGGSWADWDEDLQLECHKRPTGKTFRSVYGRMKWDDPSSVITTQCIGIGNGRFGHPEQDRALSLREAALIQTFPADYALLDPTEPRVSMQALARQIGNAVPVNLGRAVAQSIRHHLEWYQ